MAKIVSLIVVMLLSASAALSAQNAPDSRAEAAADQREEKRETVTPPRRSALERALYWYDENGARVQWRSIHFSGGSFPGGAGFGYGLGITRKAVGSRVVDPEAPNRIDIDAFAARSTRGYQRVSARVDVLNISGVPLDLALSGQNYELTEEDFFGSGAQSQESGHSSYRQDGQEFEVGLIWRPSASWQLGGAAFHLTPTIKYSYDRTSPPTQVAYADLPGISGLPAFIRADASVCFDWRDSATHPRRGGEYRATLSQYVGVDDETFDFRRLDIGVQQIIPLFDRYRRIELRGGASFTAAASGAAVPFIYQPALGGSSTLRSFPGARFRDQNAIWGRAEYQWESWWAMDTALFVDAGQVAAARAAFTASDFAYSYGIGFRVHNNSKFLARLDLAYGREGFQPYFGFKYGF